MNKTFLFLPLAALGFGACASKLPPGVVFRNFPSEGITEVVLRAGAAEGATVTAKKKKGSSITVSGVVTGGTGEYRSPDADWHESAAAQWGLNFVSRRYGSTLVISTENEISYTHHRYIIDELEVELPPSVKFVSQVRKLTDNGSPDLSAPQ